MFFGWALNLITRVDVDVRLHLSFFGLVDDQDWELDAGSLPIFVKDVFDLNESSNTILDLKQGSVD